LIWTDDHAVDDELHEKRRGHGEYFQRQRQQQHLRDGALHAAGRAEQLPCADVLALVARHEARRRLQLHRHAGVVARSLVERQHALAAGRVVYVQPAAGHPGQHDEVVHVPVQDRRQAQLAQGRKRRLHAARRQLHAVGHEGDVLEGHAAHRRRQAQPHRRQVGAQPVVAGDHRHAGDAAFRRFGLEN